MTKDLRKYTSQTNVRLAIGAILILFIIGLGLIGWFYGLGAALVGFLCLLGSLVPIGLIVLILLGLDKFLAKIDRD